MFGGFRVVIVAVWVKFQIEYMYVRVWAYKAVSAKVHGLLDDHQYRVYRSLSICPAHFTGVPDELRDIVVWQKPCG